MPSRIPVPAWLAVLSLLILALLGLWMFVHGGQAVLQLDSTPSGTAARQPGALERIPGEPITLAELPAREHLVRASAERTKPEPKKSRRFRGRVMGTEGQPCEGARVLLYSPSWSMTVDFTHANADGTFVLRYPHAGAFEVVARDSGVGTCDRVQIELDEAREQQRVDLVLNRADWLAGRLTDGDERPITNVELWAFPAAYMSANSSWLFRWRMRDESRTLRGECSGTTRTDNRGRFRFTDLEPGAYFIARRDRLDPPHDPRIAHNTGEGEIELFEQHVWLSLRCPGVPGASLFCAPVTRQGPSDHHLKPPTESDTSYGRALFEVEPCRVYRCGVFDPVLGLVEEEVSMPCRGGTVVHQLEVPKRTSAGSLALTITTPWRAGDGRTMRARIRSVTSGVLLKSWTQGEWGITELPAGEFMLDVVDPPARDRKRFNGDDSVSEVMLKRLRVTIHPNYETRVEVDR